MINSNKSPIKCIRELYKITSKDFMLFTQDANERQLQWWEQKPIKYAITKPTIETKLEMLMGSSIVRLNDRKYMIKFMAKLRENHEKQQQKRIEERRRQELIRTKGMILNRFIPVQEAPEEIREFALFKLLIYCDTLMEKKRKKMAPKIIKISKLLYNQLYPEKTAEVIKDDLDETIYVRKISRGNTKELISLSNQEVDDYLAEQKMKKNFEDGYMMSQEDYDRLHYEIESVKLLRKAQTVDDMYQKANEIIGAMYVHSEKQQPNENEPKIR